MATMIRLLFSTLTSVDAMSMKYVNLLYTLYKVETGDQHTQER